MTNLFSRAVPTVAEASLQAWLTTTQGRQLGDWEHRQLATVMPRVLGYRLLQVGASNYSLDEMGGSAMLHHWVIDSFASKQVQVQAEPHQLPIASQSVDAVLLAHSLEVSANPHALLREVDRVLCTRGQVIIVGLNPMSLWHAGRYLPQRWRAGFPRHSRLYGCGRVCDWLGLLDFEVDTLSRFGAVLPWTGDISQHHDARRWLAPFSQAYMIFARKRVVPLTPTRRSWRAITDLGPAVLPEARVQRRAA